MYDEPDTYNGADLSNLDLDNGLFIPTVAQFVYLGSTLGRDYIDEADVDAHIDVAGNAFGALRDKNILFYDGIYGGALILSILLYGSEC